MASQLKASIMVCLTSAILAGCSSNQKVVTQIEYLEDPALKSLKEMTSRQIQQMSDIAAIESRKYTEEFGGSYHIPYNTGYIPAMERYVDLGEYWGGSVESLLSELATLSGYAFPPPSGVKPANPVPVVVKTKDRRIIDIISDAGRQLGSTALVDVKAKDRVILLQYNDVQW